MSPRVLAPTFAEVAAETAQRFGVCVRPVPLQRIDLETGRSEVVTVPCGNTRESVCGPCAKKAKMLRLTQAREGWHLTEEPVRPRARPTLDQTGLMCYRADLLAALAEGDPAEESDLLAEIDWVDEQLRVLGMRGGSPAPSVADEDQEGNPATQVGPRRSTRRRADSSALPRRPVTHRTVGREFAGKYTPSMMITLTLDSYGRVHRDDGTPVDPNGYDYRRAAWDAIWVSRLFSRWIQNLRRMVGWDVQYFATVEPQKRAAPHIHVAIRGAISHKIIRQVTAATYHQVWWPHPGSQRYDHAAPERLPVWHAESGAFLDPATGEILVGWDEAIEATYDDEEPAHVVRFGAQVHSKGILGGSPEATRHIGYLCKYLTKSVSEVLHASTPRQADHYDRLHGALCVTPCSAKCAVWLLFGIVPKEATAKTVAGRCKSRAHRRDTLALPGNRVLTSTLWTGKTVGDHKADRLEFVRRTLAFVGIDKPAPDPRRYAWSPPAPGTRIPARSKLLLAALAQRLAWRAEYERAYLAARELPGAEDLSGQGPPATTSATQVAG